MNWKCLRTIAVCILIAAGWLATAFQCTADPTVAAPDRSEGRGKFFMERHEQFLKRVKEGPIDLLFIGDSITQGWGGAPEVWKQNYGARNAAEFGIGGDRTEHVLWRIDNGELEGIKPKVVVLMIGTNNTGGDTSESIAAGVTKIVKSIRAKLPESKVLLLAIFPRSGSAEQAAKIPQINREIAKLDDGKMIRYLDLGPKFLDASGGLPKEIMPDGLHLSKNGYEIWAEFMEPLLADMMK